jgi:hypothetical protein
MNIKMSIVGVIYISILIGCGGPEKYDIFVEYKIYSKNMAHEADVIFDGSATSRGKGADYRGNCLIIRNEEEGYTSVDFFVKGKDKEKGNGLEFSNLRFAGDRGVAECDPERVIITYENNDYQADKCTSEGNFDDMEERACFITADKVGGGRFEGEFICRKLHRPGDATDANDKHIQKGKFRISGCKTY